ncbi:MAG: hypothetical protein AAF602_29865 [Myxococcota bacterium]
MKDWPAAHSMDTEWFGVDENGQIARFDTGEPGAVPVDHDPNRAYELARAVLEAAAAHAGDVIDDHTSWLDVEPSELGVFDYGVSDYGVEPYECIEPPEEPLHIDALPPEMQKRLVRLPVRFEDEPDLPVGAYIPVDFWGGVPFYEDVDGLARPIVGREAEFAALVGEGVDAAPLQEAFDAFQGPPGPTAEPTPEERRRLAVILGLMVMLLVALVIRAILAP